MESSLFSYSVTPCKFSHNIAYSRISCVVLMGRMCEIDQLSWVFFGLLFFSLFFLEQRRRKRPLLSLLLSMMMSKNRLSFHPLPSPPWKQQKAHGLCYHTVTLVHSTLDLYLCFHWNHNHLNLSALEKYSRSKIRSPPFVFGRYVVGQFTRKCSPYILSRVSPLHRKLLHKRSIFSVSHFCLGKAVTEDKIDGWLF